MSSTNIKKHRQILEELHRKGNYFHYIEVLQKGYVDIVTYRQLSEHADVEDYLPCNMCFGFFIKNKLWRHEKMCRKTMGEVEVKSKKKRRVQTAASSLLPYGGQSSERCSNIAGHRCKMYIVETLSHEFTRLVIRGKRGRKVPVLLTREMTKSLDFLIEQRGADNDILDSNEDVFARQNSESHIQGSGCLRKYAAASGARKPETLTSTHLKKRG